MKTKFYLLTWVYGVLLNIVFCESILFAHLLTAKYLPAASIIPNALEDLYFVTIFSIPFSVPGLLALLSGTYLSDFFLNPRQRFIFVIVFCMTGALAGYFLLWAFMGINPFDELHWFVPASLMAVLAALLMKKKLFYKAFIPVN